MKKLLTLIAACGLAVSSWAIAPDVTAGAPPPPQAQFGSMVFGAAASIWGWSPSSMWYAPGEALFVGVYGGLGGIAGSGLGPLGTVVGASVGGA